MTNWLFILVYLRLFLWALFSDFIWDFRKLPFPSHLGKYFLKIGKISAKIHVIGKVKAVFWIENDSHIRP